MLIVLTVAFACSTVFLFVTTIIKIEDIERLKLKNVDQLNRLVELDRKLKTSDEKLGELISEMSQWQHTAERWKQSYYKLEDYCKSFPQQFVE